MIVESGVDFCEKQQNGTCLCISNAVDVDRCHQIAPALTIHRKLPLLSLKRAEVELGNLNYAIYCPVKCFSKTCGPITKIEKTKRLKR